MPLVALVCVHFFGERVSSLPVKTATVTRVFAVTLLVLAGAETAVLVSNDNFSRGSSAAVVPGGEWLFTHSRQPSILAGLSSRGLMRLPEVRSNGKANWSVYDPKSYSHLVEGDPISAEFVAVDFATKWGTRSIGGWKVFESLRKHRSKVETNTHLDAVYTSGDFVIYRSKNLSEDY